jgi:UDP-glucose 4-epimerase
MSRVLVTGGSGFIGTRLVERLAGDGHDVTVLDPVEPDTDVRALAGSVLDMEVTDQAVRGADAVVHLAGFVRAGMRSDPYAGASLQLQGTLNVLEACRRAGVQHLAYASSFYVYDGIPEDRTVDESTPLDPLRMELFGSAKLMGEALCREYEAAGGPGVSTFRIGPAYGGQGSSAVDTFVEEGLGGRRIEVWGRGDRRNQYTFGGDIADGIAEGLTRAGETYNLVAPDAVSLRSLGELLAREHGFEMVFDETRPEGPSFPYISSAKAQEELAWRPRTLAEGIDSVLIRLREQAV